MIHRKRPVSSVAGLIILSGLVAGQEAPCAPPQTTVLVLLDNQTGVQVDPGLYVHPDPTISLSELIQDGNIQLIEPLLQPDEAGPLSAEFEYRCADLGTITSFDALAFLGEEAIIESKESPSLWQGTDFSCGDEIRFTYEVDDADALHTTVRVNGEALE